MNKKFTRTTEDFVCEVCHVHVEGTGYTNHCPNCLWSKHVDKNPGDRLEQCGGIMKPISVERKSGKWMVTQKCGTCGFERKNSVEEEDNFEKIIEISKTH
jgi:hypothetical protein